MGRLGAALPLVLVAGLLSGCESPARQDPLFVRGSTDTLMFENAPIQRDRPLAENLTAGLVFADYNMALYDTGLLDLLRGEGPYTVFALPNAAMESLPNAPQLLLPQNRASLRRLLANTIVPGRYDTARLRTMIAQNHGNPVGLKTLDGRDILGVSLDPATGQVLVTDGAGRSTRLWLYDVPQSNGVLFATQSVLIPGATAR